MLKITHPDGVGLELRFHVGESRRQVFDLRPHLPDLRPVLGAAGNVLRDRLRVLLGGELDVLDLLLVADAELF